MLGSSRWSLHPMLACGILVVVAVVTCASANPDNAVVAAKIKTCRGCRLNGMPAVRAFLDGEGQNYQALKIEYQHGWAPTLYFLNKAGKVVSDRPLLQSDNTETIVAALAEKGVTRDSVRPPIEFTTTAVCVAWRQTGDCNPKDGPREADSDADCSETIEYGRSGFCECIGRANVEFTCEHFPFTCETKCVEPVPTAEAVATQVAAGDDEDEGDL